MIVNFTKESLPCSTKSHTNTFEDHPFTKKNKVTYIPVYCKNTIEDGKNTLANTTCRIYKHLCNNIMSDIITMVNVNLGSLAVYIQNSGHKTSPFYCRASQSVFWTVILVNNFVLVIIWSFGDNSSQGTLVTIFSFYSNSGQFSYPLIIFILDKRCM